MVSLGLRQGERDLEPFEIAGSLSAQIHKLVDERYRQRKPGAAARSSAVRDATTRNRGRRPSRRRPAEGLHWESLRTSYVLSAPSAPVRH